MLDKDREIFEVAERADQVTFEKKVLRTGDGSSLSMLQHDRLPFSLAEYVRRVDVIRAQMTKAGLDFLLVRSPENITYLSGYQSPGYYKYHCIVVPTKGDLVFAVRDFEWINSPEFAWINRIAKVYDWDDPPLVTANVLKQLGVSEGRRIGVEKQGWFYSVEEHETLARALPRNEWVDATHVLRDARMIKSAEEVSVMRQSAKLVDLAMTAGFAASRAGVTADHVNAVVNKTLLENGGEYMGLPPFVLAGERSCLPHQTGGANPIRADDVVYFEISASRHRYAAALMRTIFVGKPRDEWLRAAQACIDTVQAALDFIKAGVTAHEADTAARRVMTKAGFGEYYRHRLGYSIGVNYPPDWGEGEIISLRQEEHRPLVAGMTFHMPPLCLKYREYGIGFSETILVTEKGCERFSSLPRDILVHRR